MSLQQAHASDGLVAQDAHPQTTASLGDRVLIIQVMFFVSLGVVAVMAWITFLGWMAYRAIQLFGVG